MRILGGRLALCWATWFGVGFIKPGPGTFGALAALPIQWVLSFAPPSVSLAAIAFVTVTGILAAESVARARGIEDPQIVVIDEVAGTLLALWFVSGRALWIQATAVVLFRFFDILKPGPIRAAEALRPTGLGIMADDLLAGLAAGLVAWAIAAYF